MSGVMYSVEVVGGRNYLVKGNILNEINNMFQIVFDGCKEKEGGNRLLKFYMLN